MATSPGGKQCPSCGRQFEGSYQFCPFDGTTLGRKCPSCGKVWDDIYQFCPIDSTPLAAAVAVATPAATASTPVKPAAAPPPPAPAKPTPESPARPPAPEPSIPAPPSAFSYTEQVAQPSLKADLLRPMNILFAIGALVVLGAVWYLHWKTSGPDLPAPTVSYQLLPNEGKTKGVPVAIRINRLAILLIDEPMESSEGAARAKQLVAALQQTLQPLKPNSDVRFAVERVEGRAVIQEIKTTTDQRRTLVTVANGDLALSGAADATNLAAVWAERLTDAVKVYVFGQAPSFSTGTEFGQALLAMHKSATAGGAKLSKKALDNAFQRLTPEQRRALETPPAARSTGR